MFLLQTAFDDDEDDDNPKSLSSPHVKSSHRPRSAIYCFICQSTRLHSRRLCRLTATPPYGHACWFINNQNWVFWNFRKTFFYLFIFIFLLDHPFHLFGWFSDPNIAVVVTSQFVLLPRNLRRGRGWRQSKNHCRRRTSNPCTQRHLLF